MESSIIKKIMLQIGGEKNSRLFRNNTGMAWQGKVRSHADGIMVIQNPRPVHFGLVTGSSDLIGWTSVNITPEMVGRRVAVFLAIETKDKAALTVEQANFIEQVRAAGGIAGVAHDVDEAEGVIDGWIERGKL